MNDLGAPWSSQASYCRSTNGGRQLYNSSVVAVDGGRHNALRMTLPAATWQRHVYPVEPILFLCNLSDALNQSLPKPSRSKQVRPISPSVSLVSLRWSTLGSPPPRAPMCRSLSALVLPVLGKERDRYEILRYMNLPRHGGDWWKSQSYSADPGMYMQSGRRQACVLSSTLTSCRVVWGGTIQRTL